MFLFRAERGFPRDALKSALSDHSERVEAVDRGSHGGGASSDHELVVGEQLLASARIAHVELVARDVDSKCGRVEAESHACRLKVGDTAVGEVAPVGDVPGDVVGDSADGEVRVGVPEQDVDLTREVKLASAERGADAGVASADDDDPAQTSSFTRVSSCAGTALPVDETEARSLRMNW